MIAGSDHFTCGFMGVWMSFESTVNGDLEASKHARWEAAAWTRNFRLVDTTG